MNSYYEQAKKMREMDLEDTIKKLERLADDNKDRTHFLSQEAYKMGLLFAIREIEGTEMLMIKAHKELPYANPKEVEREHKNTMGILGTLKYSLTKRYEGKP